MAVLCHRLACPIDIESGLPDQPSYTFDMPVLPATLGVGGLVGVEYKTGNCDILAVCDRAFDLLNPAVSTTFTWRQAGQAPPSGLGVLYLGCATIEGTGESLFWFKA
jgi:hypothetical protein